MTNHAPNPWRGTAGRLGGRHPKLRHPTLAEKFGAMGGGSNTGCAGTHSARLGEIKDTGLWQDGR